MADSADMTTTQILTVRQAAVAEYARLNDQLERAIANRPGHLPLLDTLAAILVLRDQFPDVRLSDLTEYRNRVAAV